MISYIANVHVLIELITKNCTNNVKMEHKGTATYTPFRAFLVSSRIKGEYFQINFSFHSLKQCTAVLLIDRFNQFVHLANTNQYVL